jgi:hypothetical protein
LGQRLEHVGVEEAQVRGLHHGQREAQAVAIDPAIDQGGQVRQALRSIQPAGQHTHARHIRAADKAVFLFHRHHPLSGRLPVHPLVAVDVDLHAEGRMAAQADGHVPPLWIDEMKVVVIDQRPLLRTPDDHLAFMRINARKTEGALLHL